MHLNHGNNDQQPEQASLARLATPSKSSKQVCKQEVNKTSTRSLSSMKHEKRLATSLASKRLDWQQQKRKLQYQFLSNFGKVLDNKSCTCAASYTN